LIRNFKREGENGQEVMDASMKIIGATKTWGGRRKIAPVIHLRRKDREIKNAWDSVTQLGSASTQAFEVAGDHSRG